MTAIYKINEYFCFCPYCEEYSDQDDWSTYELVKIDTYNYSSMDVADDSHSTYYSEDAYDTDTKDMCPNCGRLQDLPAVRQRVRCGKCQTTYYEEDIAVECCT